jgi:hypothetical protein
MKQVTLFLIFMLLALPVLSQDGEAEVLVDGLSNPRNLSVDADGNIYVAEAGNAGPLLTDADAAYGASSQITMISPDGEAEAVVTGLISYREGNSLGAHGVLVTDESIWLVLGETGDFRIPWTHALVELDKETGRVKTFVDLLTLELEEDPDGNDNQQSNATDFAVGDDGTIYIANAGCNCLMTWTAEAGLAAPVVWSFEDDNPVPTAVEIGPDGDIYVGFLTGFPFPVGGSRVERWSGGELVETYEGLTGVTGLHVDDMGTIYAVEFGTEFVPGEGWAPGRVVEVTADGPVPIVEGLTTPYGITKDADGNLLVTVGSIGGGGSIIVVPTG